MRRSVVKNEEEVAAVAEKISDRRAFLKAAGFTGLGLASAGLVAGNMGALDNTPVGRALGLKTKNVEAAGITDVDILNFALNLEYLEAEFYTMAYFGQTLDQFGIWTTGSGNHGATTGGKKIFFDEGQFLTQELSKVAYQLAKDEQTHVNLLRNALGPMVVAKPAINLDALGAELFDTYQGFLTLARAFEDTGVSAYGGAAPLITSKAYLGVAAQIALTEAMHSGNLRLWTDLNKIKVAPLDSLDVVPPVAGPNFFTVDKNALAIVRTPSQVLSIVYANSAPGATGGGFFPNGMNGAITTV